MFFLDFNFFNALYRPFNISYFFRRGEGGGIVVAHQVFTMLNHHQSAANCPLRQLPSLRQICDVRRYMGQICDVIILVLNSKKKKKYKPKILLIYMHELQSHHREEYCTKIYESLVTKINSESDTSHTWSKTQMVTHPSTNLAYCCLISVIRRVFITLCQN